MKITIDIEPESIVKEMSFVGIANMLCEVPESKIMDAIEMIDEERGDWIIIDRMCDYVQKMAKELKWDLQDALDGEHISKSTYDMLKKHSKDKK